MTRLDHGDRAVMAGRPLKRVRLWITTHEKLYGAMLVGLVAIVSVALTTQGWRSRIPTFDLLTYHYGIRDYLETGAILRHGDIGSYGSFKPPGTAWLMLPGVLLFDDPRLTDYVGTALLHLSTLAGLYLLARRFFGIATATLTVLLYGLSQHGVFLAGSLWPNGRPDFYVWVVYFAVAWATRQRALYLALSLAVWGLGMYVDMALLPVLLIFPVLWLVYRPPVWTSYLAVAGAAVVLVWLPYLGFEVPRNFVDVRSQVFQQHIHLTNVESAWCDPSLVMEDWTGTRSGSDGGGVSGGPSDGMEWFSTAEGGPGGKLLSNFQPTVVPGLDVVLLVLTVAGLLFTSVSGASGERSEDEIAALRPRDPAILTGAGLAVLGLALAALVWLADAGLDLALPRTLHSLADRLSIALVSGGLATLAIYGLAVVTDRILTRRRIEIQSVDHARETRALILCLVVPWLLLLLFAEPGKPERFMWLWTLQSLFLAAFLVYVVPRLGAGRGVILSASAIAVVFVAFNYLMVDRVGSWWESSWSGPDAPEVLVVDAVAGEILAGEADRRAIGYQMYIYPFMAEYHISSPVYKVGAELDLLFLLRHGIANSNTCAEGVSPDDDFRIVETEPEPSEWAPIHYFPAPLDPEARLLGRFGTFEAYVVDVGAPASQEG